MKAVTYGYLEKAHEELLELHLMHLRKDASYKCCEALNSIRKAIIFERTGKSLSQHRNLRKYSA